MRTQWQVQLSCSDIITLKTIDAWNNLAKCPVHNQWEDIVAIETREWHVKCNNCRFGRWCGSSESDARIAERKHYTSKPGHVLERAFIVPDEVRERWRKIFGRKRTPKRFIFPGNLTISRRSYAAIAAAQHERESTESGTPPF